MVERNRRAFLGDVGRGMLIAGLGTAVASELGISPALAEEGGAPLALGRLRPLVGILQDTPVEKLQPLLIKKLKAGETTLEELTAAAALANAEAFGGEDYVGYHTAMALLPALEISRQMDEAHRPLPVLKVLYRNTEQIHAVHNGPPSEKAKVLHALEHAQERAGARLGKALREATRSVELEEAESIFAASAARGVDGAFNDLQYIIQDDIDVHRFVLAHRARGLVDVVGQDQAHTMLRQCVRYCIQSEQGRIERNRPESPIRTLLPKLLDQHHLADGATGSRQADDAWIDSMCRTIYDGSKDHAAEAVAAALAEGFAAEDGAQAICLAANQFVLRQGSDRWRAHGDSAGVHSSDAANAWRNMARVTSPRHAAAGLIVSAYHTASYEPFQSESYPTAAQRESIEVADADDLLAEAADAIEHNDQGRAAAAIAVYGEYGFSPQRVFDLVRKYTISEDGRLHGEKYYQTVREEFASTRPAFRWRHLVGLARVTASAYGYNRTDQSGHRAAGYEEACRLLKVKV